MTKVVVEYLSTGLVRVSREGHPTIEATEAHCRFDGPLPILDVSIVLEEPLPPEAQDGAVDSPSSGFGYLDDRQD